MTSDTICALATGSGGAIGIIRVSGSDSIEAVNSIFSKDISQAPANSLHYGHVVENSLHNAHLVSIDDAVVSVYRSPHSYTGEDSVELACHGSEYILNKVLQMLVDRGCRMANPGEFTQRAFMNGKMDLSQAEAVADLIASTNQATHRMAMSQLRGNFSSELALMRDKLLRLTSLLELELDFSDHEDIEFADRRELNDIAYNIKKHIHKLLESFKTGQALKRGIAVAIVGRTNVGKSTLLNRLLKDDKAIVSNIHGTTRDVIEDTVVINGVCFRFIDTAGLRTTDDEVERMGIERTYKKIEEAQIVIWLVDERPSNREIEEMQELTAGKQMLVVQNKVDLAPQSKQQAWICPMIFISAKNNFNIELLEQKIFEAANIPEIRENDVIITNTRHYNILKNSLNEINVVIDGIQSNLSSDLIAEDLSSLLTTLAEITGGEITPTETLNNIFSHFCVGK